QGVDLPLDHLDVSIGVDLAQFGHHPSVSHVLYGLVVVVGRTHLPQGRLAAVDLDEFLDHPAFHSLSVRWNAVME
ncbi:hypothetical protein AVEN_27316-1, partial [Araneus ventricosus]